MANMALFYFCLDVYETFKTLTEAQQKEAADAAQQWSLEYPLHMIERNGKFPKRNIPHFGKISSLHALALIAAYIRLKSVGEVDRTMSTLAAADDALRMFRMENANGE